eukprot:14120844-Alexandrium_andersonii.AAC.1
MRIGSGLRRSDDPLRGSEALSMRRLGLERACTANREAWQRGRPRAETALESCSHHRVQHKEVHPGGRLSITAC